MTLHLKLIIPIVLFLAAFSGFSQPDFSVPEFTKHRRLDNIHTWGLDDFEEEEAEDGTVTYTMQVCDKTLRFDLNPPPDFVYGITGFSVDNHKVQLFDGHHTLLGLTHFKASCIVLGDRQYLAVYSIPANCNAGVCSLYHFTVLEYQKGELVAQYEFESVHANQDSFLDYNNNGKLDLVKLTFNLNHDLGLGPDDNYWEYTGMGVVELSDGKLVNLTKPTEQVVLKNRNFPNGVFHFQIKKNNSQWLNDLVPDLEERVKEMLKK